MASLIQLHSLISQKPSLRGHDIAERRRSGAGFSIFTAIERSTQQTRMVYVAKNQKSSIVAVAKMLQDSGNEFEAKRLRNGNVCFVANSNNPEAAFETTRPQVLRGVKFSRFLKRPMIWVVASVLVILALLGGANTPPKAVLAPKPDVAKCNALLLASEVEFRGFLEDGQKSTAVAYLIVSSLEIGGLRSVEIMASCKIGDFGGEQSVDAQRWRATLAKSANKWSVAKMIRLDN